MALTYYDIETYPPQKPYAPNPTKGRYALNFKRASYRTQWVDLPDIASVRQSMKCAAVRQFADGSDFYTLPMLHVPQTGEVIGDSFDIARYLEENVPSSTPLFPSDAAKPWSEYVSPNAGKTVRIPLTQTRGGPGYDDYARFNIQVDDTFTMFALLTAQSMGAKFPLRSAEITKANFAKRAPVADFALMDIQGEARAAYLKEFESATAELGRLLGATDGPYFEGEKLTYADIIVGGWLNMFYANLDAEEVEAFSKWHGGVFARLHETLQAEFGSVQ